MQFDIKNLSIRKKLQISYIFPIFPEFPDFPENGDFLENLEQISRSGDSVQDLKPVGIDSLTLYLSFKTKMKASSFFVLEIYSLQYTLYKKQAAKIIDDVI